MAEDNEANPGKAEPTCVRLTPREREILGLLIGGLSNNEIGERLNLREQTVKNRVSEIYAKLGVSSRAQAVVWALQHGFLSSPENSDSKQVLS